MGVIQADENGMVMINGVMKNIWEMPLHDIAHELGIMNFIYYMLIKTGFLPPIIFMGVGALTDFGPMLRNLHLSIFGAEMFIRDRLYTCACVEKLCGELSVPTVPVRLFITSFRSSLQIFTPVDSAR